MIKAGGTSRAGSVNQELATQVWSYEESPLELAA